MHIRAIVLRPHRPTRFIYTVRPAQSFAARCGHLAAIVFDDVAIVLVGPNVVRMWLITLRCLVRQSSDPRLLLSRRPGIGGQSGRRIGFCRVWFMCVSVGFVRELLKLSRLVL